MLKPDSTIVDLDQVIATYVSTMRLPPGNAIAHHEYFLDTEKRKVVLLLTVDDDTDLISENENLKKRVEKLEAELHPDEPVEV